MGFKLYSQQVLKMLIRHVPTIDFNRCDPGNCDKGICAAAGACPHRVFMQEKPYDFPMHYVARCQGCGLCSSACPLEAIRMV
ncbi:MAG: 4Fe-4S binding protein [Dehalococcoidia bacterium]|nr:4Fe-4S binding protein [Dehalococcoidia bacterium]